MCTAIRQRVSALCGNNTRVLTEADTGSSYVYLHGHNIAKVAANGDVSVNNCGWTSVTTKSRLNAIINEFLDGTKNGIHQKNFDWYVTNNGITSSFPVGEWYNFS